RADRNANNQSIVLKLTPREGIADQLKEWTFLFTGDAEQESWEMTLSKPCFQGWSAKVSQYQIDLYRISHCCVTLISDQKAFGILLSNRLLLN
ncbi:unnamed protein product, partial [marine sediment metagenome]